MIINHIKKKKKNRFIDLLYQIVFICFSKLILLLPLTISKFFQLSNFTTIISIFTFIYVMNTCSDSVKCRGHEIITRYDFFNKDY